MSEDDYSPVKGSDRDHEHEHEHEVEEALEDALELDTQSQIFLDMRRQNLDLLRIATQVAGYTGQHGPLKRGGCEECAAQHLGGLLRILHWIDPEEAERDEEDEEEDDEVIEAVVPWHEGA